MKELKDLCRENIWNLAPYSCARTEFAGRNARVFLDANENPYNDPYNRYPDPLQVELKKQISKIKGVAEEKIFLGNGSDRGELEARQYNRIVIGDNVGNRLNHFADIRFLDMGHR